MKLVRDKVPDRMAADDCCCVTRECHDTEEFRIVLLDKLVEEAKEVRAVRLRENLAEELADLLEIVDVLKREFDISTAEIDSCRHQKLLTHGGFEERLLLCD